MSVSASVNVSVPESLSVNVPVISFPVSVVVSVVWCRLLPTTVEDWFVIDSVRLVSPVLVSVSDERPVIWFPGERAR